MFYFTVTGAVDRFFSARLVLRHCFGQDTLTEDLRDRYREHTIDVIMAGLLAQNRGGEEMTGMTGKQSEAGTSA
jgi:TetR/AcrR family transcriptional regulator